MNAAPPTPDGPAAARRAPLRTPSWRKRIPFYLLMAVAILALVQFLDRRPRDVDVFFVLTSLEVRTGEVRLDRDHLVELTAEIREGDELRATTTWTFRNGAPLEVGPARVKLRPGDYDVHFRLTFRTADGERRLFALRRRIAVPAGDAPVLVDVVG